MAVPPSVSECRVTLASSLGEASEAPASVEYAVGSIGPGSGVPPPPPPPQAASSSASATLAQPVRRDAWGVCRRRTIDGFPVRCGRRGQAGLPGLVILGMAEPLAAGRYRIVAHGPADLACAAR